MPGQIHRPTVTPRSPTGGGSAPDYQDAQTGGAGAQQDAVVQGPMGRVFNRILGLDESLTTSAGMAFTREQLKGYLDQKLGLAEGEFFRGKKLDGVADAMMTKLDTDQSGSVSWPEFRVFQGEVLKSIAPGAAPGASAEEVGAAADKQFASIDTGRKDKGRLTYDELHAGTKKSLPEDTENKDLLAQLGARIALDTADTDQRDKKVKDRTLTGDEWRGAAREMAGHRR